MKRLMIIRLMTGLLATLVIAATTQAAAQSTNATAAVAVQDEATAAATEKQRDVRDRHCLKQTGSNIKPRPDKNGRACIPATGRSYTREDIDRTGAFDVADALRRLDPSIH